MDVTYEYISRRRSAWYKKVFSDCTVLACRGTRLACWRNLRAAYRGFGPRSRSSSREAERLARKIARTKDTKRHSKFCHLAESDRAAPKIYFEVAPESERLAVRLPEWNAMGSKPSRETEASSLTRETKYPTLRPARFPAFRRIDDGPAQHSVKIAAAKAGSQRCSDDGGRLQSRREGRRHANSGSVGRNSGPFWTFWKRERGCCEPATPCELAR